MSTRAIIALPTEKGYITAWCWNNGSPNMLGEELKKYFTKEKYVRELIRLHSFSYIHGPNEICEYAEKGDDTVPLTNGRVILQHPHNGHVVAGMGKWGFFRDIETMLGQDLNYVYIFDGSHWKTYK